MTLATLTDQERRDLLREIAEALGLDGDTTTPERLLAAAADAHLDAWKYHDLCD